MTLRRNRLWLFAVPILLLTAWLGARSLNATAIWFDEYYSIYESGGAYYGPLNPVELTARVASYSVWPPAYNFTLAGWSALVSWQPVAGRALSWLCGLLAIAVVYRLARLLLPGDKSFPLIALVLMGGSAFFIYYLHELRGYTLHVLIGCAAGALYWMLLKHPTHRIIQIGFVISLVLLLYSHPVGQLWFAVLAGFHLIFERKHPHWKRIFFLFFFSGALYLPWVLVMLVRVEREAASPRGLDPLLILSAAASAYSNWLTVIIFGLCALTLRRLREKPIQFIWWWLLGVLGLALIVDRKVPFLFHIRLLMAILPALLLLAAAGLAELRRLPWLQAIIGAAWLAMGLYLVFTPSFMSNLPGAWATISFPGFDAALKTLNQQAAPQDAILFRLDNAEMEHWMNPSLQYYLYGSPLHFSLLSLADQEMTSVPFDQRLRAFIGTSPEVWVASVPALAPDSETAALKAILADGYTLCPTVIALPDMHLDRYALGTNAACSISASATG